MSWTRFAKSFTSGLLANRPAAGSEGRLFLATNQDSAIYADDGSNWKKVGISLIDSQTFTSSTTYTVPDSAKLLVVTMWGGGAGGSGGYWYTGDFGPYGFGGWGGAGANCFVYTLSAATIAGTSVTVTVGAGGTAGPNIGTGGNNTTGHRGGNGGVSVFGPLGAAGAYSEVGNSRSVPGNLFSYVDTSTSQAGIRFGDGGAGAGAAGYRSFRGGGGGGAGAASIFGTQAAAAGGLSSNDLSAVLNTNGSIQTGGGGSPSGGAGPAGSTANLTAGSGGAGGNSGVSGGAGGIPAGGGGGGGCQANGQASAGGAGARGEIRVLVYG